MLNHPCSEALRDAIVSAPEGEVLVRQATNDEKVPSLLLISASRAHALVVGTFGHIDASDR